MTKNSLQADYRNSFLFDFQIGPSQELILFIGLSSKMRENKSLHFQNIQNWPVVDRFFKEFQSPMIPNAPKDELLGFTLKEEAFFRLDFKENGTVEIASSSFKES
jgi:hypothetical protein